MTVFDQEVGVRNVGRGAVPSPGRGPRVEQAVAGKMSVLRPTVSPGVWNQSVRVLALLTLLASTPTDTVRGAVEATLLRFPAVVRLGCQPGSDLIWTVDSAGVVDLWKVTGKAVRPVASTDPGPGRILPDGICVTAGLSPAGVKCVLVFQTGRFACFAPCSAWEQRYRSLFARAPSAVTPGGEKCYWTQWLKIVDVTQLTSQSIKSTEDPAQLNWGTIMPGAVIGASLSDDGSLLATTDMFGRLLVWESDDRGAYNPTLRTRVGYAPFLWLSPGRNERLLVLAADGQLFDLRLRNDSTHRVRLGAVEARVVAASWHPKRQLLAVLDRTGNLLCYSTDPSRSEPALLGSVRTGAAMGSVAITNTEVAMLDGAGRLRRFRLAASGLADSPRLPARRSNGQVASAGKDGDTLLVLRDLGHRGIVWEDGQTGRVLGYAQRSFLAEPDLFAWAEDDETLCGQHLDGAPGVYLWRREQAGGFQGPEYLCLAHMQASLGGRMVAAWGAHGAPILDLATGKLVHVAEEDQRAAVTLSPDGTAVVVRPLERARRGEAEWRLEGRSFVAQVVELPSGNVLPPIELPHPDAVLWHVLWMDPRSVALVWERRERGTLLLERRQLTTEGAMRTHVLEEPIRKPGYLVLGPRPVAGVDFIALAADGDERPTRLVLFNFLQGGRVSKKEVSLSELVPDLADARGLFVTLAAAKRSRRLVVIVERISRGYFGRQTYVIVLEPPPRRVAVTTLWCRLSSLQHALSPSGQLLALAIEPYDVMEAVRDFLRKIRDAGRPHGTHLPGRASFLSPRLVCLDIGPGAPPEDSH